MKKKTIAYIDGFNLYYGLLRHSSAKWLDLNAFVLALLPRPDEHELVAVKYFTARVNYDPAEPLSRSHQDAYLRALAAYLPHVKIIEVYYRKFRAYLPFAKEPCRSCEKVEFATVWKTDEKRSDVNLATEMMADYIESDANCVLLVSGDTDLVAPVYYLKKHGKTILVFNPHERQRYLATLEMWRAANRIHFQVLYKHENEFFRRFFTTRRGCRFPFDAVGTPRLRRDEHTRYSVALETVSRVLGGYASALRRAHRARPANLRGNFTDTRR